MILNQLMKPLMVKSTILFANLKLRPNWCLNLLVNMCLKICLYSKSISLVGTALFKYFDIQPFSNVRVYIELKAFI